MNIKQRLTDFSYLKKIAPPGSGLVEEMIDLFIENIPGYVEDITISYQANDPDALRQVAHKMKSSVNYMGIESLYLMLQDLEYQATQTESLENLKPSIDRICEMSRQALKELHHVKNNRY